MENVWEYRELMLEGTWLTIQVAVFSLMGSVVLGLLGAWAKLSRSRVAGAAAELYTTLIRGIPDLVVMLIVFYGGQKILNDLGALTGAWEYLGIEPFTAGVVTIAFIFGAYMTETFRGAFLAIPRGQIEAAIACGMRQHVIFRRIIWPQLVRYALPAFTNNWLVLLKTTALISVIGLQDLVYNANAIGKKLHEPFTFLFVVLVIYLVLTAVSQAGLSWVDRRYSAGVRQG